MVFGCVKGFSADRVAVVALLAISLSGCQALKDVLPTKPTEPTPAPTQSPLAIPVVMPEPKPTPTLGAPGPAPTPAPAPGSDPTPPPAPPPTGGSCKLPPSSSPDAPCSMQSPSFLGPVDKAITLLTEQQPSIFDFNQKTCENCFRVKNEEAFVSGVIKNLNAAGYCAYYDGEELAVKNSNSFNDQYDILVSSGHIRRGAGSYRSTCNPSWF
jgi:hypothetical protein